MMRVSIIVVLVCLTQVKLVPTQENVQQNFRNLINSFMKNDKQGIETNREALQQETVHNRQVFDSLKIEVRSKQQRKGSIKLKNLIRYQRGETDSSPAASKYIPIPSVLPIYSKFRRSISLKKSSTKKKPKTPKYEEYSDSTGSLLSVDSPKLPADYDEQVELFETIRMDLLNYTAEGRQPNPLPPPSTVKKLIADMTRDLIDDLMTKMVIMFGYRDQEKISFIIDDDYHTSDINMDCYARVTSTFSKFCIDIQKNPYMNRFTNIFVNICNAKWLRGYKINNGLRHLCTGINKIIISAV